jgi:hypothetical protein
MGRRPALVAAVLFLIACKSPRADATAAADAGPLDAAREAHTQVTTIVVDAAPADEAMPEGAGDELAARSRHLLEAIGKGDPDLASDILFPRDGWLATRDAADPGKDWERHVAGPFRKTIHALARRHAEIERAQFVSFELGRSVNQVATRRHGWRKPLWTVHGSRLTYLVDGHTRTLAIHEMTAWRGAWYVTRLR